MSEVITIDGPSASGKSTVGVLFAQKIGFQFIDTGAIYRAGALKAIQGGVPLKDEEALAEIFKDLKIDFREHQVFLDGTDVTDKLHIPAVTKVVPIVAAFPKVREYAKKIQRQVGEKENTVMSGRDIGSEIFPDSKLKFFITASAQVRAKRRFEQLHENNPTAKYEEVLRETNERDEKDLTRATSPLRTPEDAVVIDTSNLDRYQTVEEMLRHYHRLFLK